MQDYYLALGSLFGMLIAMAWSYYMATRVVPVHVEQRTVALLGNEQWVNENLVVALDILQDHVMQTLRMSSLRDIRTLTNDISQIEDEVIDRLPDTLDAESAIKLMKVAKHKPDLVERVGDLMEFLPIIQQLGGMQGGTGPVGGGAMKRVPFQ